ncbi:hypothetical protein L6452_02778 [Arctium lappa]|uniref:Uncharacterized protein n=1 Tax=Arctium lappa TaxID=4217 RepID=A0ACB9FM09_ARCLA|nr:hypothetical protein L6452_02778 [Arctium lappa]
MVRSATSKDFLKSLKRVKMAKEMMESFGSRAFCTICIEDIQRKDMVSVLPCCHLFHHRCILEALNHSNTCPNCRCHFPSAGHHHHRNHRPITTRILHSISRRINALDEAIIGAIVDVLILSGELDRRKDGIEGVDLIWDETILIDASK